MSVSFLSIVKNPLRTPDTLYKLLICDIMKT